MSASNLVGRCLEYLVRMKKRLIPNVRLKALPSYTAAKRRIFGKLRHAEVLAHGFRLTLDPLDSLYLSILSYEPFETALLTNAIKPQMAIPALERKGLVCFVSREDLARLNTFYCSL
jgi:hypothetical protein